MWGFHLVVKYIGGVKKIQDTQCGFKLFTRDAARVTFSNLHIERWAFDVEMLWLAQQHSVPVAEVQVWS
jgi:dolichyl-phosphate beta-glucosyltransferase